MKYFIILFNAFLFACSAKAQAQELKPVKVKAYLGLALPS